MSEETKERWSSRKLAVAIGCLVLASVLLVFGHIDQATWQFVFSLTMGGYLVAQGALDYFKLRAG